jgi:hypothetical protein
LYQNFKGGHQIFRRAVPGDFQGVPGPPGKDDLKILLSFFKYSSIFGRCVIVVPFPAMGFRMIHNICVGVFPIFTDYPVYG